MPSAAQEVLSQDAAARVQIAARKQLSVGGHIIPPEASSHPPALLRAAHGLGHGSRFMDGHVNKYRLILVLYSVLYQPQQYHTARVFCPQSIILSIIMPV